MDTRQRPTFNSLLSAVYALPSVSKAISDAMNELPAQNISGIESRVKGMIPVLVSGETMPKTEAYLDVSGYNAHRQGNNFVINGNPTFYVDSQHIETHTDMSTTTVNDLKDILSLVEKLDLSQDEKLKIKENFSKADKAVNELKSYAPEVAKICIAQGISYRMRQLEHYLLKS